MHQEQGTAMTIQWLLAWYNLIFILPLFLALLYVGIYAVSGLTFAPVGASVAIVNGGFDLPLGPLSIKKLAPALPDLSFSPAAGVSVGRAYCRFTGRGPA